MTYWLIPSEELIDSLLPLAGNSLLSGATQGSPFTKERGFPYDIWGSSNTNEYK